MNKLKIVLIFILLSFYGRSQNGLFSETIDLKDHIVCDSIDSVTFYYIHRSCTELGSEEILRKDLICERNVIHMIERNSICQLFASLSGESKIVPREELNIRMIIDIKMSNGFIETLLLDKYYAFQDKFGRQFLNLDLLKVIIKYIPDTGFFNSELSNKK